MNRTPLLPKRVLRVLILLAYCFFAPAYGEEEDGVSRSTLAQQLAANSVKDEGLIWSNLSVRTVDSVVLVDEMSGLLKSGQVCGLLGPSGAGKSSFLAALAGTRPTDGLVFQYHHDRQDSCRLQPLLASQVAWLQQEDSFFEMLTVRETLELAAWLELPHLSHSQRAALIEQKLIALGLFPVQDSRIGSSSQHLLFAQKNRLSGGERRRLGVALELLTEKRLLIADEPTTGLDSTMSARVMKLIHDTAQELQIPALCVLHQPRSSVWHNLDAVILLAPGGKVCYTGPRADVIPYFSRLGYDCPEATNPAEFLLDLISIDPEDVGKAAEDKERVARLADEFQVCQQTTWNASSRRASQMELVFVGSQTTSELSQSLRLHPLRWIPRLGSLIRRSWRQNIRNSVTNWARLLMSMFNAFLMTQLFPTVRGPSPTANSMADRAALLTTASVIIMNMAYMKAADLFEKEYPVVQREQMRRQYSTLEYLLAKVFAEIPLDCAFAAVFSTVLKQFSGIRIGWAMLNGVYSLLTAAGASLGFLLGGIFAQDGLAVNAGLPVLVILMVVGVINPGGVDPNRPPPAAVQFLKHFSPFAYAVNAILVGEYRDMRFRRTGGLFSRVRELPRLGAMAMVQNGNQVLDALGLKDETYSGSLKSLGILTLGNLFCSWVGLCWQWRRPRKSSGVTREESKTLKTSSSPSGIHSRPVIQRVRL